jgi:hypothetical protein
MQEHGIKFGNERLCLCFLLNKKKRAFFASLRKIKHSETLTPPA